MNNNHLREYSVILTSSYDMNQKIQKKKKKSLLSKFQPIPIYVYKLCMIMCIGIATQMTLLNLIDKTLCKKLLSFCKEMISA